MNPKEPLVPKHGGYRKLKSFQISQLIYDVTVRFCDRYIQKRSRTHDQMDLPGTCRKWGIGAAKGGLQLIGPPNKDLGHGI
jgi:hypothetical protein